MKINRAWLEKITTSIAVTLLALMVLTLALVISNYTFGWDLFPREIEKVGLVVIVTAFFTILASVIINIMINIGRIADKFNER